MTDQQMKEQLRRWGNAHVNRYAYSRSDRTTHVLELARDLAPGTKENALRDLVGRDGADRRRYMAARSGVKGMTILPTWAVDPVRAANDAGTPHDNPEIAVDMGIPDELRWIDSALSAMSRRYLLRAIIVRTEFTVSASQTSKAKVACDEYEAEMAKRLGIEVTPKAEGEKPALTVWQYRSELEMAIAWLSGMRDMAA